MCIFNYDSFEGSIYHPNVAAKIVGLAFLSAVSAWEDYLAHAYLGYLSGYPAPNGYLPGLQCGKALNKSHALLLASGECNLREAERKMRWNSFRWVKALSKIHFKANNPFEQISEADIRWLEIAVTIRNRVAHNSDKAKSQFKEVVNRIFGEPKNAALPRGFSPGQLLIVLLEPFPQLHLLNSDEHHWGDIFEGYMSLWSRLADEICPGP